MAAVGTKATGNLRWIVSFVFAILACFTTIAQSSKKAPLGLVPNVRIAEKEWKRVDRLVPGIAAPKLLWSGDPLVHPRGIMLDEETNLLYVSDPGEPYKDPVHFPAKIVTFSIIDGTPQNPKIFFSKPGFLHSAKWGIPVVIQGRKQILVADQGEAADEYTFSGRGAKVFSVPVMPDGTAGTPSVLWEGKPFVCPTGIALVGKFIYITDPCAGPVRTRPDRPDWSFHSSAIFAVSATGGKPPILLSSGAPFTSLIGICPLTPGEFIVNDTDSARLDPTTSGGRPGFAPPAGSDRWVLRILDSNKPVLSKPERTHWTEEGPVTLVLEVPKSANAPTALRIRTRGNSKIAPLGTVPEGVYSVSPSAQTAEVRVNLKDLGDRVTLLLNVASDVTEDHVSLYYSFGSSAFGPETQIQIAKSSDMPIIPLDNKHGGAVKFEGKGGRSGGGGASGTWARFTTDNAPGHGAVYIYPDKGGPLVALAKGAPLERPISAQLSAKADKLWIMDEQNASMFEVVFPCLPDCWERIFPPEIPRWPR